MSSMPEDVADFHKCVLKVKFPKKPMNIGASSVDFDLALSRVKFQQEETDEMAKAMMEGDIVKTVDGLLDIIYVALGTLYQMGVPTQRCWDAIHLANMKKVLGVTKRGNKIDAAKPTRWVGPEREIAWSLVEAGYSRDDGVISHYLGAARHVSKT